ncbi:MAG: helicase C-terminal domain-containing protein [Candidatus Melainabacteria bacterium]|nr:helicase C-terminal domain-containing protein [Candidatus Melainabacteria bacterium]
MSCTPLPASSSSSASASSASGDSAAAASTSSASPPNECLQPELPGLETDDRTTDSATTTSEGFRDILPLYRAALGQLPQYEPRPVQETMVDRVWQALQKEHTLIVEAGTGAGKSFGYLIPLMLSGKRPVVVSTGTIALQEQLLQKDVPFLQAALKAHGAHRLKVQLAKGRRNYICLQRLQESLAQLTGESFSRQHLEQIAEAWNNGWDGDYANLPLAIPRAVWAEVASTAEDCLGRACSFYDDNPFFGLREALAKADLIITNHALYLQDVMSGGGILPAHDWVVFDEAHGLKDAAVNAFTARITKSATIRLIHKVNRRLVPVPETLMGRIHQSEATLLHRLFQIGRSAVSSGRHNFRLQPDADFLEAVETQHHILRELCQWVAQIDVRQMQLFESDLDADRASVRQNRLIEQLENLTTAWEYFLQDDPTGIGHDRVNWANLRPETMDFELLSTPLTVAPLLAEKIWSQKTAVLASATLAVHRRLDYVQQELGLTHPPNAAEATKAFDTEPLADAETLPKAPPQTLVLESPFAFERQCYLYLPPLGHLPADPNQAEFLPALAEEMLRILNVTSGRSLVLFSSVEAMRRVSDELRFRMPFPSRVQGDLPRGQLIDWFRQTAGAVLFATATFREGIDIPGDVLSGVIIDRIPFAPPDDPVHQATVERLKAKGGSWFDGYALPKAIIPLKQGVGRLIRTKSDRGLVSILDPRMRTKGYGRVILRSLPKATVIDSLESIPAQFFNPDNRSDHRQPD